jgi:hypothetical protein
MATAHPDAPGSGSSHVLGLLQVTGDAAHDKNALQVLLEAFEVRRCGRMVALAAAIG